MKDTMLHPEDLEPVEGLMKDDGKVTWDEIEDENVLINPDPSSMEGRG